MEWEEREWGFEKGKERKEEGISTGNAVETLLKEKGAAVLTGCTGMLGGRKTTAGESIG